jgi:hypothetical protein
VYKALNRALAVVVVVFSVGAASAAAASPSIHTGQTTASCSQWGITGTWGSTASNNYHVSYRFTQHGTTLTGRATIPPAEAKLAGFSTGTLAGTLKGSQLRFIVTWAPRASDHVRLRGLYVGAVTNGHATGHAQDLTTKPKQPQAAWTATGPTSCTRK